MTIPAPEERPTAAELAGRGGGCPQCGWPLLTYRTATTAREIIRYRRCRNPACERSFLTTQQHQRVVREVGGGENEG